MENNERKYKILVVEDEESQRNIYKEYLSMEGFEVLEAQDGEVALRMIKANPDIDMVLLDLMMPKIDGMRVLEQVRTDQTYKNMIIYMMTVLGTDAMIKNAFEMGADGYIIKDSMTPDQIKEEILTAIEKHSKQID